MDPIAGVIEGIMKGANPGGGAVYIGTPGGIGTGGDMDDDPEPADWA